LLDRISGISGPERDLAVPYTLQVRESTAG
jgi:hypothetical protein